IPRNKDWRGPQATVCPRYASRIAILPNPSLSCQFMNHARAAGRSSVRGAYATSSVDSFELLDMGLPEVADIARNFAVMVRVQGPDPKGLKMRNHAFHHYNSGKTMLSASGMIFPTSKESATLGSGLNSKSSDPVLVLTAASVIEPFLLQQYRESKVETESRLIPGVQIDILMEGKSMADGSMEALPWIQAEFVKMVNIPQSSAAVQSLIEASCGSLDSSWEVGWSLAAHGRGPQQIIDTSRAQVEEESPFSSHWSTVRMESSNLDLIGQSATRIALLSIPSKLSLDFPKLQTSIPKRGDLLLAVGSPFGILSPLHFFNSTSVGSIGNSYPPGSSSRSLLMADIRCLPGMEGSPVFSERAQFIGLLMRPLRQKNSGTEVQEDPHNTWKGINYDNGDLNSMENMLPNGCSGKNSPVEKTTRSICLITTDDGSWASGVLLNKQGLVLTNAHLLEPWRFGKASANGDRFGTKFEVAIIPNTNTSHDENSSLDFVINERAALSGHASTISNHRNVRVRLDSTDPWMWTDARIVYISKGPLDIALLQLDIVPDQLCPILVDLGYPSCGSKAYVIGHGLFGPRCDILPSSCLGVIAKVIEATQSPKPNSDEKFPVMLETTAAVHPGSSGGAVVNSDGRMIGLVTSNAKHGGGTVIPHLNFSIPCAALKPVLNFSKEPSPHVIKFSDKDNGKSVKGSRFAKFIAEKNGLLDTTAQEGVARSLFTNDLIPSKL
ncbi:protease-related family protein, partial [Striga asiatica]